MRRARRNFTLKPDMVASPAMPRLVPVFRFASAAVAVLAVILFGIDLLPGLTAAAPKASSLAAAEVSIEATATSQIIYWNGQQNFTSGSSTTVPQASGIGAGMGGGGGGAPVTSNLAPTPPAVLSPTEALVPTEALPPETIQPVVPPEANAFPTPGPGPTPAPTFTVNPTENPAVSSTNGATDRAIQSGAQSPILGIPPTDQQGKVIPNQAGNPAPTASTAQPLPILRIAAFGLLGLALVGVILSWVLAKKRKA
jgi:hypothetical protein